MSKSPFNIDENTVVAANEWLRCIGCMQISQYGHEPSHVYRAKATSDGVARLIDSLSKCEPVNGLVVDLGNARSLLRRLVAMREDGGGMRYFDGECVSGWSELFDEIVASLDRTL
jgi:hypothetical protein